MEFTMQLRQNFSRTCLPPPAIRKKKTLFCAKNNACVCTPLPSTFMEYPRIWKEMFLTSQLCDGTVNCSDGVAFKIHRAILAASSSYFRVLFTNSINRNQKETFEANVGAPSNVFSALLDFAYTGNCAIDLENVEDLIKFADQYQVLGCVHLCSKFLLDELNARNCFRILKFASAYFCTELVKQGHKFVLHNFEKVLEENVDFLDLELEEVIKMVKDDGLNVKSEKLVFRAIVKWITHKKEERQAYLVVLVKYLRLGTMSSEAIAVIINHSLIKEDNDSRSYLVQVFKKIQKTPRKINLDCISLRPRLSYNILFAIGGWSAGSPTNFVETYDIRADKWLISSDTDSEQRAYHGVCVLDGIIYIIGGFDGQQYFNSAKRFYPITHTWNSCACMNSPRCYVSVTCLDNKIYAIGGFNGRLRMNSVERYNPIINQWEMITPMRKPRSDAGAATLLDKIYVVGGFCGQGVLSSVEVFDLESNQWSYIPDMLSPRSGVSLVVFDNILYAFGGFNGYNRLKISEKYIPSYSRWSPISAMVTPRSNFATAILDDLIYVIGGFNGSFTTNLVEFYKPETNSWHGATPMNLNRSALGACVMAGLPNNIDYSVLGRDQQD